MMTEQADETRQAAAVDDRDDDITTDAERLETLEAENAALRGQVAKLSAMRQDADARDRRLAAQMYLRGLPQCLLVSEHFAEQWKERRDCGALYGITVLE